MKYLNFIFLVLILCSLHPTTNKPCTISGFFYKNGKLIKKATFDNCITLDGDGIKNCRFFLKGKRIITDSIVYKIN